MAAAEFCASSEIEVVNSGVYMCVYVRVCVFENGLLSFCSSTVKHAKEARLDLLFKQNVKVDADLIIVDLFEPACSCVG